MVIEDGTPEYDQIVIDVLDAPDWDNGAIGFMIRELSASEDDLSVYEQIRDRVSVYNVSFDSEEKNAILDLLVKTKQQEIPYYETCIIRQDDNVIGVSASANIEDNEGLVDDRLYNINITIDKHRDACDDEE